jgi:hypothetical protein
MFGRLCRLCVLVSAGAVVIAAVGATTGCDGGGDSVDDTSGVFETPVLFTSNDTLPDTTPVTAVRAVAVNDNRVAAVEADIDPSGKAYVLVKDGEAPVVVARSGDSLPGTAETLTGVVHEVVADFMNENVYVDSSDRLVFLARKTGDEVVGAFRVGFDGTLERLAVVGDSVGTDAILSIQAHLAASPSGLVAFIATLESSGLTGVFFVDAEGTIHKVALEGENLPENAAVFNANFSDVFVNDRGYVAFKAKSLNSEHTWRWKEGDPALTVLTCRDHPVPGYPPGTNIFYTTTEGIHADGRAVICSSPNILSIPLVLHRYSNCISSDTVLIAGTPAPSGDTWGGLWPGDLRAVPSGWVSCVGAESDLELVLFRQKSGMATEVARVNGVVPNSVPEATISGIPRHRLGASGKIVYFANTDRGQQLCRMNAAGQTSIVAWQGMGVPGSATATINTIDTMRFFVNGTGGVVYTATASDGSTAVLTGE